MLTSQQIVTRACQIAKRPAFTLQAGQSLNQILSDLTREYDLAVALNSATISISGGGLNNGTGPYQLPANYLRMASREAIYLISGIPYVLIQITLAQFDALINTLGIANFPTTFATDLSTTPPSLYVYPPPILQFNLNIRYYGTMPEITTPEASSVVPWFPDQGYLVTRLAGELMRDAGDPRQESFLGDGPFGAVGILRRFLNLQGDRADASQSVQLDRRFFGPGGKVFPPSKVTGGV